MYHRGDLSSRIGPRPGSYDPAGREKSTHHLTEGYFEFRHLFRCADADANMVRPDRPHTSDDDLFLRHGRDHFTGIALGIDHEAVGDRLHVGVVLLLAEAEHILTDIRDELAAIGDQALH